MKGSDKTFGKWLGGNWMWLTIVGVMLAGVAGLGYKIFSTYAEQLPYISNDHTAWASFGSLLAGFFTLTGTVATVATLLFLAHQNKVMQKVTQAQLDSMTFERYINHRKLFLEQLKDLEIAHNNAFRFRDPNHLYNTLFPENSPHHCVFSVVPDYDRSEPSNHVAKIYNWLDKIQININKKILNDSESNHFLLDLIVLSADFLMIEFVRSPVDGDLEYKGEFFGVNIYSLDDFFKPAISIANLLLRFTNNPVVGGGDFVGCTDDVRFSLIENCVSTNTNFNVKVRRTIRGLPLLYFLNSTVKDFKDGQKYIFPDLVALLSDKFGSSKNVNELADDKVFDAFVAKCYLRVNNLRPPENTDQLAKYEIIRDTFFCLKDRKYLGV